MSQAPTLINLPPPPSDPVTPSDVPSRSGTPNSTTTSMSELSTVAIKDGHRGHTSHVSQPLESEQRADRISRLAGLERSTRAPIAPQTPTYFDSTGNPAINRERSTVGSASATGSVGGRTELSDQDMQDPDHDMESVNSEDGAGSSLVGFGEGARTPGRQSITPRLIDGMTYDENVVDTTGQGRGGAEMRESMDTTSADRMETAQNRQPHQQQQMFDGQGSSANRRFGEK